MTGSPLSDLDITVPEFSFDITAMTAPAGIRLRGEVDIAVLPALELALEILVDRAADATVDLSDLTFIDVCGLRALARTAIRLRRGGGCLRLRGLGTRTRRILYLLGWAELFELTPAGPVPRSSGCQRRRG